MSRSLCSDCGSSRGLAEYSNGSWCHACHTGTKNRSLIQTLKTNKTETDLFTIQQSYVSATSNKDAEQYLKQFYFKDEDLEYLDTVAWSPLIRRICFSIYNEDEQLVGIWARSIDSSDSLKWLYLGDKEYKHREYFKSTKKEIKGRTEFVRSNTVCITEDVISAYRVADFVNTICLAGTYFTDKVKSACLKYENVVVWLDGDIAGIKGAEQIKRAMKLFRNIKVITTKRDPKTFSSSEIFDKLFK